MVGNDIVDLNFVDPPAYHHLRYLDQVCTRAEALAVRESADPSRSLAVVWASKEAAYKLFSKQRASGCFVPRQFVTQPQNEMPFDYGVRVRVTYSGNEAAVAICGTNQWIHAIATLEQDLVVRWMVKNIAIDIPAYIRARNESEAARSLARQLLLMCGLDDAELRFVGRIPMVRRKVLAYGEIGISLSHHGAFVSAAIALPPTRIFQPRQMNHDISQVSSGEAVCSTCMA